MCTDINDKAPLVSVIMPAYNAERFIEEAISSVRAQTITDWELLIIDDCSTDKTRDIANTCAKQDSRIYVIKNEINLGVAVTRNYGIEYAKGKYIAFLDSDDRWHATKLEQQIKKIEFTCAGIAYCSYSIVDIDGIKCRADYLVPESVNYGNLLKENCIQCSAMLIPAEILRKIKFNTDYYHEDYILGLDILNAGYTAVGCSEVLLDWRYIANSRSFDKKKSAHNRWKIYRDYLKLHFIKCLWVFACYTIAGIRKYYRKK